jgi:aryl-alcohol dehydrogenase-like predicted oxidoreductase
LRNVDEVKAIADEVDATPAQLAIAWLLRGLRRTSARTISS